MFEEFFSKTSSKVSCQWELNSDVGRTNPVYSEQLLSLRNKYDVNKAKRKSLHKLTPNWHRRGKKSSNSIEDFPVVIKKLRRKLKLALLGSKLL